MTSIDSDIGMSMMHDRFVLCYRSNMTVSKFEVSAYNVYVFDLNIHTSNINFCHCIALYQKATRLGTAVFKNKNSFLSDVELMWFGGPNDSFPFTL